MVNFDHEAMIWDEILKSLLKQTETIKNKELLLNLTFPPLVPYKVKEKTIEIMFEYYGFGAFYPVMSGAMLREYALENYKGAIDKCFNMVVETGHSATYAMPFFDGECINHGIKKLDVGGRLMANHLKETITFRYLDVSSDLQTMIDLKENLFFISQDIKKDLAAQ